MMAWCKLEDTFASHPKFFQLARRLNVRAAEARGLCATLWSWAIQHAPDGNLSGCESEDIERIVGWEGEPGACVREMVALRVLDQLEGGELVIHDWMSRAGSFLEARRQARKREKDKKMLEQKCHARVTGESRDRHGKITPQSESRERVEKIRSSTYSSSTPPDDTVRHEEQSQSVVENLKQLSSEIESEQRAKNRKAINQVFECYRGYRPQSFRKRISSTKEYRLVKERLTDGYSSDEICRAIHGAFASPWHNGQNDRKRKYQDLSLIVRDQAKLAQFLQLADEHYTPAANPEHARRCEEFKRLGVEFGLGEPTPKELEKMLRKPLVAVERAVQFGGASDWGAVIGMTAAHAEEQI